MSLTNSPYQTDFLLRLLPWPQKHTWTVWMPANNNLSPTPPLHNSLQPLTFKLFSCPLLLPVFVFLFMISIWLDHVLQIVHSVIRSVVFSSRSLFGVYFPFNSSFPNASFLGLIVCCFVFFHFLLSYFFPPSFSPCLCSMVSLCFRPTQVWTLTYLWVPYDKTSPSAIV